MAKKAVRDEITIKSLATGLGVSVQLLNRLAQQGVVIKTRHGHCEQWASVRGYIEYREQIESDRAAPDETSAGERVKSERARKLKLENDEKELRLVQMPDAVSTLDAIVGPLKADLAGVPARVSDDVAARRRIEDAIDIVLTNLADRFRQAVSALRAGRDPLSADETDDR